MKRPIKQDLPPSVDNPDAVVKSILHTLEENHPELSAILNSITDAFYVLSRSWQVLYWSRQAEKELGRTQREVLGKDFWACYPEEVDKGLYKNFQEALISNNPVYFEQFLRTSNRWYCVSAYPAKETLLVFLRDTTERREKDITLNEVNERFSLLSKATSEAIWDWKFNEGKFYWHGENCKRLFGYDLINAFSPFDFWIKNIHPDDRERVLANLWRSVEGETQTWSVQYWFRKADNSYAYIQEKAYILRNDSNKAVRVIGSMSDTTTEKQALDELKTSEENYRLLFDCVPIPQFIFHMKTLRLIEVNEAALKTYRYTREEALQLTVYDLLPPGHRHLVDDYLRAFFLTEESVSQLAKHIVKGGQQITAEVKVAKIMYKNEMCIFGTVKDMTEKIQLEKEVAGLHALQKKKLTEAFVNGQEKEREYVGKELHDNINQVLSTAKLYLECGISNESIRVEMMDKSMTHITKTINEIRTLSRFLMPSLIKQFRITEALSELADCYNGIKQFSVNFIHVGNTDGIGSEVKLTLFRIAQEQMNNVAKHAAAKNVSIKLNVSTAICLSIKDDGVGFDTSKKIGGVGFRNIHSRVKIFNGKIRISSTPGDGCSLLVKIPFLEEQK